MELAREGPDASRKRLEARLLDPAPYMPWARRFDDKRFGTDVPLVLELPRELYGDEFATINGPLPTATGCMAVSLVLLVVDVARQANVDVMVEELVDKDTADLFRGAAMPFDGASCAA